MVDEVDAPIPNAVGERVKAVIAERRARRREQERLERKESEKDQALVVAAAAPKTEAHGKLALPDQVQRLTHVVRKRYLALLCEPEVIAKAREILTGGNARDFTNLLAGLRDLLSPDGVAGQAPVGNLKLTVVNRIPRPAGSPVVDVTPRASA